MLIDWVTARVGLELLSDSDRFRLRNLGERIQRFNPRTGEQVWETTAWDSICSDSHSISYRAGSDAFWMQGSPARVMGDGDAVFGSGASAALDLPGCVLRMRDMLARKLDIEFPKEVQAWKVSRVDVTGNLYVGTLPQVRHALSVLRNVEGGRYRVSQQAGDTVYWSNRSRIKSGKAYAKGPHLGYLMKIGKYEGRRYTAEEIELANGLVRLEFSLKSQYWRERASNRWWLAKAEELSALWRSYFERMIGDQEVNEMNVEERIRKVADSEAQVKGAMRLWLSIKGGGWEQARSQTSKRTWYRYRKVLRQAGLSDADLSLGRVVEFRKRVVELSEVKSWEELHRLAA